MYSFWWKGFFPENYPFSNVTEANCFFFNILKILWKFLIYLKKPKWKFLNIKSVKKSVFMFRYKTNHFYKTFPKIFFSFSTILNHPKAKKLYFFKIYLLYYLFCDFDIEIMPKGPTGFDFLWNWNSIFRGIQVQISDFGLIRWLFTSDELFHWGIYDFVPSI